MTRLIRSLDEIASHFDVAVLDQYGVLHNGAAPYDGVADALRRLAESGKSTAILSNSGKRSELNRRRIESMGIELAPDAFVETSGETAWRELASAAQQPVRLFPVEARPGDAEAWARGSGNISIVRRIGDASALLLMGMPPNGTAGDTRSLLAKAKQAGIPLICTNPDRTSPAGDDYVLSPGVLADQYECSGGKVIWYGKPHRKVFSSVRRRFPRSPAERFLLVGDSLLHDICGGSAAGFTTCFIRSGIHRFNFSNAASDKEILSGIQRLCADSRLPAPDYSLDALV